MAATAVSTAPKPESWPTIEEAAAQLGTSVRTIWRYAKEGAIQTKKRKRDGKKPENVCNPRDVERLMPAEVHVMPPSGEAIMLRRQAKPGAKPWEGALEVIATILTGQRDADRIAGKLWLTLDEATDYSGLCRADLLTLCQHGKIGSRKSGGWKIRRASLDDFSG